MSLSKTKNKIQIYSLLAILLIGAHAQALGCRDYAEELAFQPQKIREGYGRINSLSAQYSSAAQTAKQDAETVAANTKKLENLKASYNLGAGLIEGIDRVQAEAERDEPARAALSEFLRSKNPNPQPVTIDPIPISSTFANVVQMMLSGYQGFTGAHAETVRESFRGFWMALRSSSSCEAGFGLKIARESMSAALALIIQDIPETEKALEAANDANTRSQAVAKDLATRIQAERDGIENRNKIVAQATHLSETCPLVREASLWERRMPR